MTNILSIRDLTKMPTDLLLKLASNGKVTNQEGNDIARIVNQRCPSKKDRSRNSTTAMLRREYSKFSLDSLILMGTDEAIGQARQNIIHSLIVELLPDEEQYHTVLQEVIWGN